LRAPHTAEKRYWPDWLIFASLCLLVLFMPWPWGANTGIAKAALGVGSAALLLLWVAGRATNVVERPALGRTAKAALLMWVVWIAWIGLQVLPLPPALLESLSPKSLAYHEELRTLHSAPLYTISIAPGATIEALADTLALFSVYCLGLILTGSRGRIRQMLTVILVAGLLQALYGIYEAVVGAAPGGATGAFINRNHFASFVGLCAAAGIGLVLADLRRWSLPGWKEALRGLLDLLLSEKLRNRILVLALVVALVLSRSRLGNLAFFAALALAGTVFVLMRMRSALIPALLLFASLAVIDLLIVSRWFGLEQVVERIEQTDLEAELRPLVWQDLLPAVRDYALTGSGLGSFSVAFSPYRGPDIRGFFDHAHNEYAEFVVETGHVGLVLLGLLVGIHVVHAIRILALRRRAVYAGAAFACLMSTFAVLIHASGEFMLRIPAVAVTWVLLLAVCAAIPAVSPERRPRQL
jgi:putative inorganic carbon (hco3(-)) transporter